MVTLSLLKFYTLNGVFNPLTLAVDPNIQNWVNKIVQSKN